MTLPTCSQCGVPMIVGDANSCPRCLLAATDTDADAPLIVGADESAPCELLSVIGETSGSVTFLGQQTWPVDRFVAFKLLKEDAACALAQPAPAAALRHPHISAVLERGRIGSRAYIMTPYLGGGSLPVCCDRHGALPAARVAALLAVADAVSHAHARGLGHGHLVAANVLCESASSCAPLIVDFLCNSRRHGDATLTPALARADVDGFLGLAEVVLSGSLPDGTRSAALQRLRRSRSIYEVHDQLTEFQIS